MTWPLLVVGILLALLGLWGGPAPRRKEAREASKARGPASKGDAWEILTQPVVHEEELIKLPEHRPWYRPGRAGHFQRGLMTGLGAGLMIAAAVSAVSPQGLATQPPKTAETPKTPAPTTTNPTNPGNPPTTTTPPTAPANVTFVVQSGDAVPTIATNLKAKGLITDGQAFINRVAERSVDTMLKAGSFVIPAGATIDQVIDILTK